MCTCIDFVTEKRYFGRNLDIDYRLGEKIVITPENYSFDLRNGEKIKTKSAIIGMAVVQDGYPLYFEGANAYGLAMAGLNFPENAHYFKPQKNKLNLAQFELIPYFLGLCKSVAEVKKLTKNLVITDCPFNEEFPVSPLHWMVSDGSKSIVLEQVKGVLRVYDNPYGVLTNNPQFSYHLENIKNYMNLSSRTGRNSFSHKLKLRPYGMGMGAVGLPGDTSPASRFVRAAFNKFNSNCEKDEEFSVTQVFHILSSVAAVKGATVTESGKNELTEYSCCINLTDGVFYYNTYFNNRITAIKMTEKQRKSLSLTVYSLNDNQDFKFEN